MDPFLAQAIEQARKSLREGGLPIGSVLVRQGRVIGAGHNRRVQHGYPMEHAEIDCLNQAGVQETYADTILYSTLMPCFLCSGAVVQFQIPHVIVGEARNFPGGSGRGGNSLDFLRSHGVKVDLLDDPQCVEMMRKFIAENPLLWNGDIGR